MFKLLTYITFLLLLSACNNLFTNPEDTNIKYVAKAGDSKLSEEDYTSEFIDGGVIKDSLYYSKKALESWAIETLFYEEALKKLEEEDKQIEKKVQLYRQELINYMYQSRIIEANLDTNISKQEIEDYYNEHRDNFILKENIVKVNYIKVPVKAPGLAKIKRLVFSANPTDAVMLRDLCAQNAENYFLNDSTWLFLENIKKEIPILREQPDFSLSIGRLIQFTDDLYYYYLKIKDVKVKNGLSPLNFERQNIKKFIINNRKTQIIIEYKQQLLEKAKTNKSFVVY